MVLLPGHHRDSHGWLPGEPPSVNMSNKMSSCVVTWFRLANQIMRPTLWSWPGYKAICVQDCSGSHLHTMWQEKGKVYFSPHKIIVCSKISRLMRTLWWEDIINQMIDYSHMWLTGTNIYFIYMNKVSVPTTLHSPLCIKWSTFLFLVTGTYLHNWTNCDPTP